tara:strand:+ start:191 stop:412 length:222 start_codon:yes stop_codon:yes gene_type:complete
MKYINFNHLKEANSNYWHHFKYSGLCTFYCACALPIGIIHTIFPFIGDWLAIEMILKIVNTTKREFSYVEDSK